MMGRFRLKPCYVPACVDREGPQPCCDGVVTLLACLDSVMNSGGPGHLRVFVL